MNAFLKCDGENFHTFQHRAPKRGQFADNKVITGLQFFQDIGDLPLALGNPTRNSFLNPLHLPQTLLVCQLEDVEIVFLKVLVSG